MQPRFRRSVAEPNRVAAAQPTPGTLNLPRPAKLQLHPCVPWRLPNDSDSGQFNYRPFLAPRFRLLFLPSGVALVTQIARSDAAGCEVDMVTRPMLSSPPTNG